MSSFLFVKLSRISIFIFVAMLCLLPVAISADSLVSFQVDNLLADNPTANWMYDYDNPGMQTDDGNPLTFSGQTGYTYHKFAWEDLRPDSLTNAACLMQGISHNLNTSDISLDIRDFSLVGFQRVNTVNPLNAWDIPGQGGVRLTYMADYLGIDYLSVPKLILRNAVFIFTVPFPSQQQINALGGNYTGWSGNLGTGLAPRGYGYAEVDTLLSAYNWIYPNLLYYPQVPLYCTNVTYSGWQDSVRIAFQLDVGNGMVDYHSAAFQITPSQQNVTYPHANLEVAFSSFTPGGASANENDLYLSYSNYEPTLPCTRSGSYTELDLFTTLESFNASLTFTIEDFTYYPAIEDLKMYYKATEYATWEEWEDIEVLDATHFRLNNVNVQGYFASVPVIPYEIPWYYCPALDAEGHPIIMWVTESETEIRGFNIYRSDNNDLANALILNPFIIPATNTSNQCTYTFTDEDVESGHTYYYWLEYVTTYDEHSLHGPQSVTITGEVIPPVTAITTLSYPYPNPVSTGKNSNIYVTVKSGETAKLSIFNSKGQTVKTFTINEGEHVIQWNGSDYGQGVYFYKLVTPSVKIIRKFILLK